MAKQNSKRVSRRKFLEMAAVTGVAGVAAACAAIPTEVAPTAAPPTSASAATNTPVPPTSVPKPPTTKQSGGTISMWVPLWNPSWFHHGSMDSQWALAPMREYLFYSTQEDLIPALATGYKVSDDRLTYTISLRQGVRWHDGQPFTADDVKYSFELSYDSGVTPPSALPAFTVNVKGMSEYHDGKAKEIEGIRIVDDHTVQFVMSKPDPGFTSAFLGYPEHPIMPKHVLERLDRKALLAGTSDYWVTNPIGTGPYKFVKYVPDQFIEYARNEDYWGGKPGPEKFLVKFASTEAALVMLEKGEIDLMRNLPATELARLEKNPNIDILAADNTMSFWIATPNWAAGDGLWRNPKARQALMYAINRQGFVDSVMRGYAKIRHSWFDGTPYACPTMTKYTYDPAKAKALFDEIGMTQDKRAKYTIDAAMYPGSTPRAMFMTVWQDNLRSLGFKANVDLIDASLWGDYRNGKGLRGPEFDFGVAGNGPGTNPWYLDAYISKGSTINVANVYSPVGEDGKQHIEWRWQNDRMEELFDMALQETDPAKRKQYLQEIDCIYNQDPFWIPMIAESWVAGKTKRLQGIDWEKMASVYLSPHAIGIGDWWIWEQK